MKTYGLAAPVLAVALAFSAQAASPKGSAAESDGSNPAEQVVCFVEPATGSHIKKRVCMTQAEREARMKADQETMGELKRGKSPSADTGP